VPFGVGKGVACNPGMAGAMFAKGEGAGVAPNTGASVRRGVPLGARGDGLGVTTSPREEGAGKDDGGAKLVGEGALGKDGGFKKVGACSMPAERGDAKGEVKGEDKGDVKGEDKGAMGGTGTAGVGGTTGAETTGVGETAGGGETTGTPEAGGGGGLENSCLWLRMGKGGTKGTFSRVHALSSRAWLSKGLAI